MLGKILPVAREGREFLGFNVLQRVSERHFATMVMMAVSFTVSGDVDEFRPCPAIRKGSQQPVGEGLAVVEQAFECHAV